MKNLAPKNTQAGSVLIVVLVMLVLLTLVGTWAIRGSINSLKISTSAQAQALLKQTSDSVFGGVSKSMLKQSRLNFDKIEKCE